MAFQLYHHRSNLMFARGQSQLGTFTMFTDSARQPSATSIHFQTKGIELWTEEHHISYFIISEPVH